MLSEHGSKIGVAAVPALQGNALYGLVCRGEQRLRPRDAAARDVLHRCTACARQKYAIQMVFAHTHRLRDAIQCQRLGLMPIQIQLRANAETIPRLLNLFLCRALQAQRQ